MNKRLIYTVGPSGVGKDSLLQWLVQQARAEHRAQRLALIEEVKAWAEANTTALDDDWRGFNRILHQFGDRWRDGGHVGEKMYAELLPQWQAAIAQDLHKKVWPLLEAGKVKPVIHATFPLQDAKLAHELMESSKHIGKIMLEVKS